MKAIDFELCLIFIIMCQFSLNVSRENIMITAFILFVFLMGHYFIQKWSDLFE